MTAMQQNNPAGTTANGRTEVSLAPLRATNGRNVTVRTPTMNTRRSTREIIEIEVHNKVKVCSILQCTYKKTQLSIFTDE